MQLAEIGADEGHIKAHMVALGRLVDPVYVADPLCLDQLGYRTTFLGNLAARFTKNKNYWISVKFIKNDRDVS